MLTRFGLPRTINFLLQVVLINVVAFSIIRVIFFGYFYDPNDPMPAEVLSESFYLGVKYDLRLSLFIILPILLLAWSRHLSIFKPVLGKITNIYLTIAFVFVVFLSMVNFAHYAYLQTSVNAAVLRFLEDMTTSAEMVWDTYPVVPGVIALIVIGFVYYKLIGMFLGRNAQIEKAQRTRKNFFATITLTGFVVLFGMYGKLSYYPLRWSDAFFSTYNFAASVASNPVLYFATTLKNRDVDFDVKKAKKYYPTISKYLGVDHPDQEKLNYTRLVQSESKRQTPPNVVMVFLESFASFKTGIAGNPLKPTPVIDQLANDGYYFKNFFTPTMGTARSVFTALTGLPDIEEHRTSSRNPLVIDQHIIINDFKGYDKYYFLGGSMSWGNIRGFVSKNIAGIQLHEEGDFTSKRVDMWGISDPDLFREANKVLTKTKKPFFAIIQTSGNHPPYNIPEWETGFKLKDVDINTLKKYGFVTLRKYNAIRFMDYSVKILMEEARKEPYFDNTIFVFFGDHGYPEYPGVQSAKKESQLGLNRHRVPFIIYAPKLLGKPKTFDKVASEVDVLPTLADLADVGYKNTTLGRDLLDPKFDGSRYAFIRDVKRPGEVALINDKYYYELHEYHGEDALFAIDSENPRENVIKQHPEVAASMKNLTDAFYQTAKYMRYHNNK